MNNIYTDIKCSLPIVYRGKEYALLIGKYKRSIPVSGDTHNNTSIIITNNFFEFEIVSVDAFNIIMNDRVLLNVRKYPGIDRVLINVGVIKPTGFTRKVGKMFLAEHKICKDIAIEFCKASDEAYKMVYGWMIDLNHRFIEEYNLPIREAVVHNYLSERRKKSSHDALAKLLRRDSSRARNMRLYVTGIGINGNAVDTWEYARTCPMCKKGFIIESVYEPEWNGEDNDYLHYPMCTACQRRYIGVYDDPFDGFIDTVTGEVISRSGKRSMPQDAIKARIDEIIAEYKEYHS